MTNRNASAAVFGFEFQEVAGLILTLFYIKDVKEISIEGQNQDIELVLNNNKVIYAQAKATTNHDRSTFEAFKKGVETLIENSQLNNVEKLIYVTNSIYPLGKRAHTQMFFGDGRDKEKRITFNDFRNNGFDIDSYIDQAPNANIEFNRENFQIHFYKLLNLEDKNTKYEVALGYIQDFLVKIGKSGYKNEIFDLWGAQFHRNSTQKETLKKEDFIWKMIVRLSEVHQFDKFQEYFQFEEDEIEEVVERFGDIINDLPNWFEVANVISSEYISYRRGDRDVQYRELNFVKLNWERFQNEIISLPGEELTEEIITKLILWKILNNKTTIKKVLKESGL